jgi:hypothetical protein
MMLKKISWLFKTMTLSLFIFSSSAFFPQHAQAEITPTEACEKSLERYSDVAYSWYQQCRQANEFSAKALDNYTVVFNDQLGLNVFHVLLKIKTKEQSRCAIDLAHRYSGGPMTATFIWETCVQ